MKNPKISVIIPCFNCEKFLKEAIKSVLDQTYKNLEIIIVDDGSKNPKKIEKIVKSFKKNNIKLIKHKKNLGLASARNTGIKNSSSELIAFLDADDLWSKTKLEKQIKFIKKNSFIFTNWYTFYRNKKTKKIFFKKKEFKKLNNLDNKKLLKLFIKKNFGNSSSIFAKKRVLLELNGFDKNLKSSEDYDLWLRALIKNKKFYFIEEPLTFIRIHKNQMSKNIIKMKATRLQIFLKIIFLKPSLIFYPIFIFKILSHIFSIFILWTVNFLKIKK